MRVWQSTLFGNQLPDDLDFAKNWSAAANGLNLPYLYQERSRGALQSYLGTNDLLLAEPSGKNRDSPRHPF